MNDIPENLLLVSATAVEVRPLLELFGVSGAIAIGELTRLSSRVSLLVTGVGITSTAYFLGVVLSKHSFDFVLNVGICGAFDHTLGMRRVVIVDQEAFADLGAESSCGTVDLFAMGLANPNDYPFTDGRIGVRIPDWQPVRNLPRVSSVTVNRVLFSSMSIADVQKRFSPSVVNMEGAAVFFACKHSQIPTFSLRAVSDLITPDVKSSWDIPGAVSELNLAIESVVTYVDNA